MTQPHSLVTFYSFVKTSRSEMWNEQVRKYLLMPSFVVKQDFLLPKELKTVFWKAKKFGWQIVDPIRIIWIA